MRQHVGHRQPGAARERMAGAGREDQRFGLQQLEAQAGHEARIAHAADHQVEVAGAQGVEQRAIGRALDDQPDMRPARAEFGQRARQQVRRHAGQCTDAQALDAGAGRRRHGQRAGIDRLQHPQGMHQQLLAGRRQPLHATAPGRAALHQPRAGQCLELGQGLGDGRLAQGQSLGGARQVTLLRDRHQTAQVSQLHATGEGIGRRDRHGMGSGWITVGYEKSTNRQFTA